MEGKVGKRANQVSDLPVTILHQILKCLPVKDAIRTSVLSKHWNSIQKCFPILEFKLPGYITTMPRESPEFEERNRELLEFVDRSLRDFVRDKLFFERIGFHVLCTDRDSVSLVHYWLPLALHNGVSDLSFFFGDDYPEMGEDAEEEEEYLDEFYPLPETTFLVNSSLLSRSSEFFCLQKLKLSKVFLSENIVHDIIRNCPNLRELWLLLVIGPKTLSLSKADKLVSLIIWVPKTSSIFDLELTSVCVVDAFSLKHFSLTFDVECFRGNMIDLTSCYNLRELELENSSITDASFNLHISRLTLLEVLKISFCNDLRMVKIFLQRLKHLKINGCHDIETVEIDAPLLSKFVFTIYSYSNCPELVLANAIPGSMHIKFSPYFCRHFVNSSWFLKLREFLTAPFKGKILSLCKLRGIHITNSRDLSFDHNELRDVLIPPVVEVDCLDLLGATVKAEYLPQWNTLLDGLLWSCHPKMIRATRNTESGGVIDCVKALCELLKQSGPQLSCKSPRCKCWRRSLKEVKLVDVNGIEIRDFNADNSSNSEGGEVRFQIDWDHLGIEE